LSDGYTYISTFRVHNSVKLYAHVLFRGLSPRFVHIYINDWS